MGAVPVLYESGKCFERVENFLKLVMPTKLEVGGQDRVHRSITWTPSVYRRQTDSYSSHSVTQSRGTIQYDSKG